MKVNNRLLKIINTAILFVIVIGFIFQGGKISEFVLSATRNELIPLASVNPNTNYSVVEEIFPLYDINNSFSWEESNEAEEYSDNQAISISKQSNITNQEETIPSVSTPQDSDSSNEGLCESESSTEEVMSVNAHWENIDIGTVYSLEQLKDFEFLVSNCYLVDSSTSVTTSELNAEVLLSKDMSIDLTGDEYKVLVYHTHGSEAFADSRPGVTDDTIIGVGDELTRLLEEDYGIKTYHDTTVYDIVDGKLDRNYAYTQSGIGIDKILAQYPSIEVILDIHRDGVRDEVRLVQVIDGRSTAQIMFFNGVSRLNEEGDLGYLDNPNITSNLSFSLQMYLKGKSMYGDLMRKIYIGGYCYNLNRVPRASLVEVGAQTNTVGEAKNAMIPLAAIVYSVLSN